MKTYKNLEIKYLLNKSIKEKQEFKNKLSYLNNLLCFNSSLSFGKPYKNKDIRNRLKIQPPNYNHHNFEKEYEKYIKECEKCIKGFNKIPFSMKVQELLGYVFCISIPISIYFLIMFIMFIIWRTN